MRDFVDFLTNSFKQDYIMTRETKLSTVLEKCYEFVQFDKDGLNKVTQYLEGNKKCKLPWSAFELDKASESVINLLENKKGSTFVF